jgi:hypothetical protein
MHKIAELNMLVRGQVELPAGLSFATDEFREGWCFVQKTNAERLKRKVHAHGWCCIKTDHGVVRSGVGPTLREATASALKLTLRHIDAPFNAVEVEHIEITQYPWFFLVRVCVYPYLIQQSAILPVTEDAAYLSETLRQRRLRRNAAMQFPAFGAAMPQLKQMLISSRAVSAKARL